jgi:hypothetical protein
MAEVIHVFNFEKIKNRDEVPDLVKSVLNGAKSEGYTDGLLFLNCD